MYEPSWAKGSAAAAERAESCTMTSYVEAAGGGPRFGVWALEEGAFGSPHHPEDPHDARWVRIKGQVLLAEELGFDSTLIAQLFISPWGEQYDQGEAWSLAA